MLSLGIDVSKHQGKIDWHKVKLSGVTFAILRAGYGRSTTQKDPTFDQNYEGCKANGINAGAYWYSYAKTEAEAVQEAQVCLSVLKGKQFEYPIFFDIEEAGVLIMGKEVCSRIVKAFLTEIEKAGYCAGIYASKSPMETHISDELKKKYEVWVAHYGVSKTSYKGNYGMWQKSSTGKVDGIAGHVDLDECYVDYPNAIKIAGLNGFKPTSDIVPLVETPKKTNAELAKEVIDGKWGNGEERKKKLTDAGYDYKAVQAIVNEIVSVKATKKTHMVVKGDTLSAIAKKYGTTVEKILTDNKATYPKMTADHIQIGWKLKI